MPNTDAINHTIELLHAAATRTDTIRFWMGDFLRHAWMQSGPQLRSDQYNVCGTRCCIAGFANMARIGHDITKPITFAEGYAITNAHEAARFLGLTDEQANALFLSWPNNGDDPALAIHALEELRDTGVVPAWWTGEA